MYKNILIGSGLSSLGFLENIKKDFSFEVYDKNLYYGGHAHSFNLNNFFFDEGAHILHSKDEEFLQYIGANDDKKILEFQSIVTNFYKGKEIGYPIQFNLKDLSFSEKIEYLISHLSRSKDINKSENYFEWLLASYGKFLSNKYYSLYTKKYWRTDPRHMSVNWVKGRLAEKKLLDTIKSLFFKINETSLVYNRFKYPKKNGFFNFFDEKYSKFDLNLNHEIKEIDIIKKKIYFKNNNVMNYNVLVSAIPLIDYKNIISNIPKEIYDCLLSLKHTSLITYNYKIKKKINYNFHWCYFYDLDIPISRMSILNNFSSNKEDHYFIQGEVFYRNDEIIDIEAYDKKTRNHIIKFFKLDSENEIIFEQKKLIDKAYPVPLIGDIEKIDIIKKWLNENNIFPIGLYGNWKFMWSDQTFNNGKEAAQMINKLL